MNNDELKPCPFCGIESHITENWMSPYVVYYSPECMNPKCCCTIGKYLTKQEAINSWNTRKGT